MEPLVVVDAGPVEEAAHVDAPADRVGGELEAPLEIGGTNRVVVGADAVFGDEQWGTRYLVMEAAEDPTQSVGPDAVAERRDRRVGRMRDDATGSDAHRRVVGEADQVERAGEVGTLDRVASRHPQHAVAEQAEPCVPVHLVDRATRERRLRDVVLRLHRREPEDRCHRCAGLPQPYGGLRCRQLDGFGRLRPFVTVVVPRRPTPTPILGRGVVVRLVDRLPPAHQVAESLGHEIDVARPRVGAVGLDEEAAGVGEPARQREVVQADPRLRRRRLGPLEHVAVVRDRRWSWTPRLGLDPGPLDREAMMRQAERRVESEVIQVSRREPVAVTRRRRPARTLPLDPVGRGCRPLALRRRRRGAPHEPVRPLHLRSLSQSALGRPSERAQGLDGQGGTLESRRALDRR